MKHTECKDCELGNGDCGYHFKMDGATNYDIASLSACDQYGNCMFFKSKAKPKGDLISREALEEVINDLFITGEYDCNSVLKAIDNAPAVELANHLRDRIQHIDHEITIPQSYEAKCFLDGKRKAFQYVLDLLEIKRGGEE